MPHMFVPGPVDVAEDILQAQTHPMIPHRSKEFEEIFHRAANKARQLFYTDHRVFLMTNSGSGCQEACVRNLANEKVLSCTNGAFSNRFNKMATSNGKKADKVEVPLGQAILPEMVAEALKKDNYELITIVHNETSSGVRNPVKEIAEVVHRVSPDTLIAVDAVSSLGGDKIEMDAWGIDVLFTSSQKTLALPPGLALCAVNDRALKKAETVENRGWYFDFLLLEKHRTTNSTPNTPAMSLIFALDKQLDRIAEEGLENRIARHAAMAARSQEWAAAKGWEIFPPEGYRSRTITVLLTPEDFVLSEFNKAVAPRGMRLAGGYGPMKNTSIRIAHMGEIHLPDLEDLLSALDEFTA
ncbi:MAG: alanine--glyoxylate aminotransferase family protein [Anaerolineales bacterium]|nr:alanine--glyoxylate aminotransferase family protein [Anaerolineales bacterium]